MKKALVLCILTNLWAYSIIPMPQSLNQIPGTSSFSTTLAVKNASELNQSLSSSATFTFVLCQQTCDLNISKSTQLKNPEAYGLIIKNDKIEIQANTKVAQFYAIKTLEQLLASKSKNRIAFKNVEIIDEPQFAYRGSMLDLSRSFFNKDYILKHIDRLAFYKFNFLHLHLTDDQGWRIEIPSRPLLTEVSSNSAVRGGVSGFLSMADFKEIQKYANSKNITIVPEIDLPGHIYAALRVYPELNCKDYSNLTPAHVKPPEPYRDTKVKWSKLCLAKTEATRSFVSDVIGDLVKNTTGPYIHIGGDEISDSLFLPFISWADTLVNSLGKTMIGWQEIRKAQLNANSIVQIWRRDFKQVAAETAKYGYQSILSPCNHTYLDHANDYKQLETTLNWCEKGGIDLAQAYEWVPSHFKNIYGVEAPIWTEMVHSESEMDNRAWPRLLAIIEVAWTREKSRDFDSFINRLDVHRKWLKTFGIKYYPVAEFTE